MAEAVIPSTARAVDAEVLKGALAHAGLGDWVVPTDTEHYAGEVGLTGAPLNAFDATSSGDSLTVTIASGEGYIGGAWLGRDDSTDVDLDASTSGQAVAVGPRYETSDAARIDVVSAFADDEEPFIIWEFDTDSNGVTSSSDERNLSQPFDFGDRLGIDRDIEMNEQFLRDVGRVELEGDEQDVIVLRDVSDGDMPPYTIRFDGRPVRFWAGDGDGEVMTIQQNGGIRFPEGDIETERGWMVDHESPITIEKDGNDGDGIINFKTE